jgi:hypothetical protein
VWGASLRPYLASELPALIRDYCATWRTLGDIRGRFTAGWPDDSILYVVGWLYKQGVLQLDATII